MPFGIQEYRQYALPALAVLETILTKGKSPGATAMGQERIFQDADNRNYQRAQALKQEQQAAKEWALREKLGNAQIGEIDRKKTAEAEARKQVLEEKTAALDAYNRGEFKKDIVGEVMDYQFRRDPLGTLKAIQELQIQERLTKLKGENGAYVRPIIMPGDDGNFLVDPKTGRGRVARDEYGNPIKPPPKPNPNDIDADEVGIPGITPRPGVKLSAKLVDKMRAQTEKYQDLKDQIATYRKRYKELGPQAIGEGADELDAMVTGMQLTLKELQNLGVLNGPDLFLMQKQIPNAAGMKAKAKGWAYGAVGQDPILPKLNVLDNFVTNKYKIQVRTNGFQFEGDEGAPAGGVDAGSGAGTSPSLPRVTNAQEFAALPSGAQFVDPKGIVRRKP